ncbi:ABC transporter substrate-binding protein [Pigmentiphaga soli]|uniref:Thiamine pyrimidine synthase n=1 Tax=Pigmentiphaga soli TaxID=1007095 RepID=A0ABP8HRT3_9BURK
MRIKPMAIGRWAATAALALLCAQAQAQPLTKVRFMLDWRFEGPAALFLLPKAKGYFEQEGLDVSIDAGAGGGTTITRVASGSYDIGFADMGSIIEFMANNVNNPAAQMQATYVVYDSAPMAVFTLKKDGIAKPADLAGKTLGAPVFDPGRRLFPVFAKANGIDPASVKWTSMDPSLRETLLQRGQVQGITGFYFTSLMALTSRGVGEDQLNIMKYADNGVKMYGNSIFATKKYIDQNPKVMAAFIRAFTRGAREVLADPDASIAYVKAREPMTDVALEKRRLRLAIDSAVATPAARANGIGAADPAVIRRMVTQIVDAYGLKATPDSDALFSGAFMPPQPERMIFGK